MIPGIFFMKQGIKLLKLSVLGIVILKEVMQEVGDQGVKDTWEWARDHGLFNMAEEGIKDQNYQYVVTGLDVIL